MPDNASKDGWRKHRFDEMAVMVNDRIDDPAEADVEHYVGLEHLDADSLTIRRWGSPSDVEATKLRFRAGDIIFGRRRVYQRKLAVADFDGICSAHAMVLRARPEVALPEFLPFFMQSDFFMERAKQISVGSLSPTINWKTLAKEEFSLPPLEEQRRIAKVLGAAVALPDSIYALDEAAWRVLASAAAHEFDELLGDSVPMVRLGKLCSQTPQSGIYKSGEFRGRGTRMVNMGELFGSDMIDDNVEMERIDLDEKDLSRYALTSNDLLFGRRSVVLEGAGRCVLVGNIREPVVFESSVLRVTVDPARADSRYVFEWLRSPYGHQQIRRIVTFTTVSGVAGSDVSRLPVPLPSLQTQSDIARRLSGLRTEIGGPRQRLAMAARLSASIAEAMFGSQQ